MQVGVEPLAQFMRRICGSYVYWYNKKYARIGNLFQDRFKSEPAEDDAYFLTVLRYIHQNPCKAGLEKTQRNIYLKKLKYEYNLSIRQIARITGINRDIVCRA